MPKPNQNKAGKKLCRGAHIKPVHKNGKSILGNLLVLCPNHHKEFDLGARKITEQDDKQLVGVLNEKPFSIKLINI